MEQIVDRLPDNFRFLKDYHNIMMRRVNCMRRRRILSSQFTMWHSLLFLLSLQRLYYNNQYIKYQS